MIRKALNLTVVLLAFHVLAFSVATAGDLEELKMHVAGFDTSPYGVEWMRFEPGSPVADLIRTVPHIAFEVDDLEEALTGKEMIGGISSPSEGARVAMILHNGMPVELIEFAEEGSE